MSNARGLVLVRMGRGHHFGELLAVPAAGRTWDLAVSLYDDIDLPDGAIVEWHHRCVGGKWDGIWRFFSTHPEVLAAYDFYWLVDDDIEADSATVTALFDYVRAHGFELAQPALTTDSYYSHRITLACPGFRHRHTNLVEIMAPILARGMLHQVLPIIQETRSGFGLDWLWQRFVTNPHKQIAIIDSLPVRHARPLRQTLRPAIEAQGSTPEDECARLVCAHGLTRLHGVAIAGVKGTGRTIQGRLPMALALVITHWRQHKQIDKRPWGFKQMGLLIYRQLFAPLNLSKNDE